MELFDHLVRNLVCQHGLAELLQDGDEDPAVEGQHLVHLAVHEEPGEGGVHPGHAGLDGVLGQGLQRLPAEVVAPGVGGHLPPHQLRAQQHLQQLEVVLELVLAHKQVLDEVQLPALLPLLPVHLVLVLHKVASEGSQARRKPLLGPSPG